MDYKIAHILRNLNIITQKDINSTCNLKFKKNNTKTLACIYSIFFHVSKTKSSNCVNIKQL